MRTGLIVRLVLSVMVLAGALAIWACGTLETKRDSLSQQNNALTKRLGAEEAGKAVDEGQLIPYADLLVYPGDWVDMSKDVKHPAGVDFGSAAGVGGALGGTTRSRGDLSELGLSDERKKAGAAAGAPGTEIWVIGKTGTAHATGQSLHENAQEQGTELPIPGGGTLAVKEEGGKLVPVPLKHTDVAAQISGYIASVAVTQQFQNPYSSKIEAVYVFPLPENAGINEFVMTIGERHIRGIIREREEAQKIYKEARQQGYVASLMTQERPNIFTQSVANIEPGKQIDIQITYFHTLSYSAGWYEWVFPMVVGPRYNPAGSTQGVGAVARGSGGISGQATEVQYLRPEERSGHDIGLTVKVDPGVSVVDLVSVNHQIRRRGDGENRMIVELDAKDSIPNKDFVLRYKVAGKTVKSGLFVRRDKDGKGGYFTLMIVPPETLASLPRRPVEMVFVVDTSGSMSGRPIAQAKAAVDLALGKMAPADTFQVVKFDSSTGQMSPTPLGATPENIAAARQYVQAMEGGGGTEMLAGMNRAMEFPHDPKRTRVVAFLTDGYIGNEMQILKALHKQLQDSRVFSFGIGTSVNRYLIDSLAVVGQGTAAYLSLNESATPVMEAYFERISHPALANIKVSCGGMKVTDVYPRRIPELFVGRPIIITGRFTGEPTGDVVVSGKAGGEELTFRAAAGGKVSDNAAIGTVWARMKIADLEQEAVYEERDVSKEVRETALEHGLMSAYTSFVAVDSTRKTDGDHGTTVAVPVRVPEGVRYDTTVQEKGHLSAPEN